MQIGQGARPLPRHRWHRRGTCGIWEVLVGPCLNVIGKATFDKSMTLTRLAGISVTEIRRDHGLGRRADGGSPGARLPRSVAKGLHRFAYGLRISAPATLRTCGGMLRFALT
jgi:hypothetical protein